MQGASSSREDYLKALYVLSTGTEGPVTTNALAEHLSMRPASASGMMKQLAEAGWVEHEAYRGASLTPSGERIALDVIRRHRLWEFFLVERLGFAWDQVHHLAERLEHIEDAELINRLDDYLGCPDFDPHGDPIPRADGTVVDARPLRVASELGPGERAVLKGVVDSSDVFLRHLDALDIRLGIEFKVVERHEFDGSARVEGRGIWTLGVLENLLVVVQP